jgi:hypothetical protein
VEFTLKYLKKSFAIRNCTFGDQREKNQKRGIVNREVMKIGDITEKTSDDRRE